MQGRKLTYRFHDPNPAAAAADCILKVFIEVNAGRAEAAIQKAANAAAPADGGSARSEGHSA